jgi:hypothetical protein
VWQVEEVVFGGDVQGNDVDNGNNSRKKLENSRNIRFPNSSQRLKPDIKSSKFTLQIRNLERGKSPRRSSTPTQGQAGNN